MCLHSLWSYSYFISQTREFDETRTCPLCVWKIPLLEPIRCTCRGQNWDWVHSPFFCRRKPDSMLNNLCSLDSMFNNLCSLDSMINNLCSLDRLVYNLLWLNRLVYNLLWLDSIIYNLCSLDRIIYNLWWLGTLPQTPWFSFQSYERVCPCGSGRRSVSLANTIPDLTPLEQ